VIKHNELTLNAKHQRQSSKRKRKRKKFRGGGSLPLASAAYGVFRYPLCGALPRNAPKIVISD
jgi:hypothetical protein